MVGEPWFQNVWLFGFGGPKTRDNRLEVVLQRASQVVLVVKNLPADAENIRDVGSVLLVRKIPWRRAWQFTPVFLPRNLMSRGI